jgi:hypothetical protein
VAITAKRLMAFLGESTGEAPAFFTCIWRGRAEQFGSDPGIKQWTVRDENSAHGTLKVFTETIRLFCHSICKADDVRDRSSKKAGTPS